MSFIEQFHYIISNPDVKKLTEKMLLAGKNDPLFSDYFGINFLADKIHSVKLYFTFNKTMPDDDILRFFLLNDEQIDQIKKQWQPSGKFERMHQGFTFGLKCYLKNTDVKISRYLGYRVERDPTSGPQKIKIPETDRQNFPGVCMEENEGVPEFKRYYFTESKQGMQILYDVFKLNEKGFLPEDFKLIEYAESDQECKVNLIVPKAEKVKQFLESLNNPEILLLSRYFYDRYQLYYYGPGIRLNHPVHAIYFLPKEAYETTGVTDSIRRILSMEK